MLKGIYLAHINQVNFIVQSRTTYISLFANIIIAFKYDQQIHIPQMQWKNKIFNIHVRAINWIYLWYKLFICYLLFRKISQQWRCSVPFILILSQRTISYVTRIYCVVLEKIRKIVFGKKYIITDRSNR